MKRYLSIVALLLIFCMVAEAKKAPKSERKQAPVCLTLQAENGTVKQKLNEDGTITCIIRTSDLIRVSSIVLDGEDISYLLVKNKLNVPVLAKDATLEIVYDEPTAYQQPRYNTIVDL